jgi:hypothetical protein
MFNSYESNCGARYAKKNPTPNKPKLTKYTFLLNFRPLIQASRCSGSIGHGAFLFHHSISPLIRNKAAATENTKTLFSENQISWGTVEISPANVAPSPIVTNSAGKAQQIRVLKEVKRLR